MRLDDYGLSLSLSLFLILSLSLFLILSFFCIDGVIEDRRRIGMLLLTALNQMKKKTTMVLFIVCYDSEFLWSPVSLSLSPLCPSVGLTLLFSFVFFFSRVLSFPVLCLCLSVSICLCPWIISACLGHCLCAGFIRQYALSKQWNHLKVKVEIILYVGLPCKGTSSFLSCNVTWEEWHALYIQQFHFL